MTIRANSSSGPPTLWLASGDVTRGFSLGPLGPQHAWMTSSGCFGV